MQRDDAEADETGPMVPTLDRPLLVGDYLWRRWYAKTWWILMAVWWLFVLALSIFDSHHQMFAEPFFSWVTIILHPQSALPGLSFGYVRKLFAYHGADALESEEEHGRRPSRDHSLGFDRPCANFTDPLDPRWMTNPVNPSSEAWRDKHVRGKF